MTDTTNGDLPPVREAIIEQAQRVHQELAHERDVLRAKLADAEVEIAGLKAQLGIAELDAARSHNRAESAQSNRDEAIGDRAVYEALFIGVQALFRAFKIPSAPLVRERTEEDLDGYEDNLNRDDSVDSPSLFADLTARGRQP